MHGVTLASNEDGEGDMERLVGLVLAVPILLAGGAVRAQEPGEPAPLPEPKAPESADGSTPEAAPAVAPASEVPRATASDAPVADAGQPAPGEHVVRVVSGATTLLVYGPRSLAAAASPPIGVAWGSGATLRGPDEALVPLCATPCELRLTEGAHVLALSPDGKRVSAGQAFEVSATTRELAATYDSRLPYKVTGGLVLLATVVVTALVLSGGNDEGGSAGCESGGEVQFCHDYSGMSGLDNGFRVLGAGVLASVGIFVGIRLINNEPRVMLVPR